MRKTRFRVANRWLAWRDDTETMDFLRAHPGVEIDAVEVRETLTLAEFSQQFPPAKT